MNILDDIKWRIDAVTSPLRNAFQRAERLYWDTKAFSQDNNYPEKDGLKKIFSNNIRFLGNNIPIFHVLKSEENYNLSTMLVRESIRDDLNARELNLNS